MITYYNQPATNSIRRKERIQLQSLVRGNQALALSQRENWAFNSPFFNWQVWRDALLAVKEFGLEIDAETRVFVLPQGSKK